MLRLCRLILSAGLLVSAACGQQSYPFFSPSPAPPLLVTATANSPFGQSSYCYWVVVVYPIGKSTPSAPSCVPNAIETSSVLISWSAAQGASSYDVLRTTTPILPNVTSNIAVATAVSGTTQTDSFGALSSYTISSAVPATANLYLDNTAFSTPQLRAIVTGVGGTTAFNLGSGGGGTPGGTNGQVQYNNAGAFGGFTVSGDATLNTGTGALTLNTVTVSKGGTGLTSVTSNALVKGNGTGNLNVSACTVDSSNNLNCPGSLTSATGSGVGGALDLTQGTLPALATTAVSLVAPASVTSYEIVFPGSAASGIPQLSNAANVVTMSITATTGSANVVLSTSPTLTTPSITTINDGNGNPFIASTATASAVDSVTITNAATANPALVKVSATGSDTNINEMIQPKGNGQIFLGPVSAAPANVAMATVYDNTNFSGLAITGKARVSSTATDGVLLTLGFNGTGDRELLLCDSAAAINSSNGCAEFLLGGTGMTLRGRATDGSSAGGTLSLGSTAALTQVLSAAGGLFLNSNGTALFSAAANQWEVDNGSVCNTTAANCRDLLVRHTFAAGAAPTLTSGTGTILGGDEKFRVTLTAGSQTTLTVTFGTAYVTNIPAFNCNDETTAANNPVQAQPTLSTVVINATGTFGAADKITCVGGGLIKP